MSDSMSNSWYLRVECMERMLVTYGTSTTLNQHFGCAHIQKDFVQIHLR